MLGKKNSNWLLMYVAGNPEIRFKVCSDASNPQKRSCALDAAKRLSRNNWRVWVEHKETGKRIFESEVEKKYLTEKIER
jgi:hypothetical protein